MLTASSPTGAGRQSRREEKREGKCQKWVVLLFGIRRLLGGRSKPSVLPHIEKTPTPSSRHFSSLLEKSRE